MKQRNSKIIRIIYPIIEGKAGGDVYFQRLQQVFKDSPKFQTKLIFLPHILEKLPLLIPLYIKIKKIRPDRYDLIHTNAEFGHYFVSKRTPLIVTIHHNVFDRKYVPYKSLIQKIFHQLWIFPNLKKSLQEAQRIICVSEYTKKSTQRTFGIKALKFQVIYNGIDTSVFKPLEIRKQNQKIRLLYIGNNTRRKGFDLLPKIMKNLGKDYELYYNLGLRSGYKKAVTNMFCLGRLSRDELVKEYNKCDIFLFPTRFEGFGYVLVEAMACGKPVVSTNTSSIPEVVDHNKTGFLCKLDNTSCFVKRIRELARNPNKRERMGVEGIKRMREKFGLKRLKEKYKKLYEESLENETK